MVTGNLDPSPTVPRSARRWLPLLILLVAFIALTQYVQGPSVEPVICNEKLGIKAADVVMLSASWCRYCRQARGWFVSEHVNYCEYDIEKTETGAALYQGRRFGAIPVIFIAGETRVGFDRADIESLLAANGLLAGDND